MEHYYSTETVHTDVSSTNDHHPQGTESRQVSKHDGDISADTYSSVVTVLSSIIVPLILFIGLPTNIVNCVVFYRQGLRERVTLCLFTLAAADATHLTALLVIGLNTFVKMADQQLGNEYDVKSTFYLVSTRLAFKAISLCVGAIIAVERCVCVVWPLHANTFMSRRCTAVLLASIAVTMVVLHQFFLLKYFINRFVDQETGQISWELTPTKIFIDNTFAFHVIDDVLTATVLHIVTFVVVSGATVVTVVKLRAALSWRSSSSSKMAFQSQEVTLTRMLVFLSCIYIACSSPFVALAFTRLLVSEFKSGGRFHNFFWMSHYTATVCASVNSGFSFFVYLALSSKFRLTLRNSCFCRKGQMEGKEPRTLISLSISGMLSLGSTEMAANGINH